MALQSSKRCCCRCCAAFSPCAVPALRGMEVLVAEPVGAREKFGGGLFVACAASWFFATKTTI